MSTGILSIGTSALTAAYTALRTTGNNISNVSTPGYTRQVTVFTPQVGQFIGGNYLGQGVAVTDIQRQYNDFLTQQAHRSTASASETSARSGQLSQISNLFADSTNNVGSTIDQFFSSLQSLSQRPADSSTRQGVLSAANVLAQRFNDIGNQLQNARSGTDQQIAQQVSQVNRLAAQVADLNDKIALARGNSTSPNDLLDARDAAVRSLNQSIGVSVVKQDDGGLNLFLANGQPLVIGSSSQQVYSGLDPEDPQNLIVGTKSGSTIIALDPNNAGGGAISGFLKFRSSDLPQLENDLGRLAVTLADQINTQQKLGQNLNGAAGTNLFAQPQPTAYAAATNGSAATIGVAYSNTAQLQASDYRLDFNAGTYTLTRLSDNTVTTLPGSFPTTPYSIDGLTISIGSGPPANGDHFSIQPVRSGSRNIAVVTTQLADIAAANPVKSTLGTNNLGTVSIDDLSVNGPTRNPALTNATTLTFTSATTYTITDGTTTLTAQPYTAGQPISFNGWSVTLSGIPKTGDTVGVSVNTSGTSDNGNAIKLAALQNSALVGGAKISEAYAASVARVGGDAQAAQSLDTARNAVLQDSLTSESSVSGVNLDEEASKLIQFQQQYQAAAKLIATASTLFDSILQIKT